MYILVPLCFVMDTLGASTESTRVPPRDKLDFKKMNYTP